MADNEDEPITILAPPINQGEEPATVGVSTVSLSSSPVGGEGELEAIPEEALEVGTEKGIACKCTLGHLVSFDL